LELAGADLVLSSPADELVEIGRISKGKFQPTKFLDEGAELGETIDGYQIVKNGDEVGVLAKGGSYLENLPRYRQLFREGKISELFSELKKTTAFPKMGKTVNKNFASLYQEYKLANPQYDNCPYLNDAIGTDFQLEETSYFVRLYSGEGKASKWIFRIEDLKKYNGIDELVEDLAIPFDKGTVFGTKPSKIALVEVPKGTNLRKSFAGGQIWKRNYDGLEDLVQKGGGIQYEILNINFKNIPPTVKSWFAEVGDISEMFK
jgi:hypothetical protein